MPTCLAACVLACLPAFLLPICPHTFPPIYVPVCLHSFQLAYLLAYLPTCLSAYLPIPVCQPSSLPAYVPTTNIPAFEPVYLTVSLLAYLPAYQRLPAYLSANCLPICLPLNYMPASSLPINLLATAFHLTAFLGVCLPICLPTYLSAFQPGYSSVCELPAYLNAFEFAYL